MKQIYLMVYAEQRYTIDVCVSCRLCTTDIACTGRPTNTTRKGLKATTCKLIYKQHVALLSFTYVLYIYVPLPRVYYYRASQTRKIIYKLVKHYNLSRVSKKTYAHTLFVF